MKSYMGGDNFHHGSDVLLPPRKRLLAGLKRQNSESTSQDSGSPESSSSTLSSECNAGLHNLLKFYKNDCHMSPEEIARAARSAAAAAAKVAGAARAAAEEKAAVAVKAVAAAKEAMSLVTSVSMSAGFRERQSRKYKLQKHVPVHHLYTKQQMDDIYGTDEELARKLHQVINSSPRIVKHSPGSESNIKQKKLKTVLPDESHGTDEVDDIDSHGSYTEKALRSSKPDRVVEISGDAESGNSTEKLLESPDDIHANGRNRGRNKLKKMPVSFGSLKDRANPKDDLKESSSSDNTHMSTEPAQRRKCQDFKVPQGIKPIKVAQF